MARSLRSFAHSFCNIQIYLVFVTKYRHPVLDEQIESDIIQMCRSICEKNRSYLVEAKADLELKDHIHLLVDLAPDVSISKLANTMKTVTSREIRKRYEKNSNPITGSLCSGSVDTALFPVGEQQLMSSILIFSLRERTTNPCSAYPHLSPRWGSAPHNPFNWIQAARDLVTPRAYSSFILAEVSARAAIARDWKAFWPLLWEALRQGSPRPADVCLYLGMWLIPPQTRRWLRSLLTRERRALPT